MAVKNWIIYIVTLISLTVFCILYIKQSGFVVLMIAVFVPILFSAAVYIPGKKGIKLVFPQEVMAVEKYKKTEIPIQIENHSSINAGSAIVVYFVEKRGFGSGSKKMKRKLYLGSQYKESQKHIQTEEILFEFVPTYSGIHEIWIEKIRIYNGFSLFCPTIQVGQGTSFLVMPEYREFSFEPDFICEEKEGESDVFSAVKAGNDPSELFEIRYYRPGDKLNRINWKFSAKHNALMVQEYGFPVACDLAVFIDIAGERDMDKAEKVIEVLYFLMMRFIILNKMFYVIWKDGCERGVKRRIITSQDEIFELFLELFRSGVGTYTDPVEDIYDLQYEGEFLTSCIFIYTGRKDVEAELVRTKVRADSLEFIHV